MRYLTQRATVRRAVAFAAIILGVPSIVAAQAPWDPPLAGTRFYFSGNPQNPIQIESSDATSVKFRWDKRSLEGVGLFDVGTPDFHKRTSVNRHLVAGIFPLEVSKRVEWQGSSWNFSLTVVRREQLKTKLGVADTYVVELHQKGIGSNYYAGMNYEARTEFWYAPAYRFWVKYVHWHIKGQRSKDWDISEEVVKVEGPDGSAVAQATPAPSTPEPPSRRPETETAGRASPRAERPNYKVGDTWIRTDGTWKVLLVDTEGYLFSDGSGSEFRLTGTLAVSKIVVRGAVEMEIATPNIEWPLEVGRSGSSLVQIVVPPRGGSLYLRNASIRHSWSVTAYEDVKTLAGTFAAFKILNRFLSWTGQEHFSFTTWFAPSVARIVKAESRIAGLSFELAAVAQTPEVIASRPSEPTPAPPKPDAPPAAASRPVPNAPAAPSPPLPAPATVPTAPAAAPSPQVVAADTEAPRIALNYPPEGTKLNQDHIVVVGLVTDNVAVEQVLVSLNGKMVAMSPESAVSTKSRSIRTPVTLQPGENVIEVTAVDKAGNASQIVRTVTRVSPLVAAPPPPAPVQSDRWAVVIGIGNYESAGIPRLRFSVPDAEAFYRTLLTSAGLKKDNVLLLTDRTERKPTLKNIKYALGTFLARAAKKDDTVLIFFAGHGAPESDPRGLERDGLAKYLIPSDADPDDLFSTALPMDDLQAIFGRIESERVVAFVDACYSGAAGGRTFAAKKVRTGAVDDLFLERLTRSKGRAIITAARPAEVSIELPDLGHGVFTYYLIEGLRGAADLNRDGVVTLQELYEYLEQQVTRKSRSVGAPQHPVMKGELEGVLPLTKVRSQ